MPINYYCGINLNQTTLGKPVIDPLATPPDVGTEVAGQMYFDNAGAGSGIMYFWNGTAWRSMDATAASGVTSFSTTKAGNSTGNPLTALTGATGAVTVNSFAYAGGANIGHVPAGGAAGTFLRGDGVFATPAGGGTMSSWDLGADTGTVTSIADADQVNFLGDANGGIVTKVDTSVADASVFFQLDINDLVVNAAPALANFIGVSVSGQTGTGKSTIAQILALAPQGDVTGVIPSAVNAAKGISVTSQSGPVPVVGLDIIGQTNLAATAADDDELVIYDLSTTTNKSITVANLMAAAPQGDITAVIAGTGLTGGGAGPGSVTLNAIGGAGILVGANDIAVDYLGADSVIKAAPTLSRVGAASDIVLVADTTSGNVFETPLSNLPFNNNAGIVTSLGAGTFVTITGTAAVPIVNAEGTTAATASKLIARDAAGFGFTLTPSSGDSSTKIATTAFVQQAVTGLLEFISGFNANTGIIADGSGDDLYTDRAVAVGDYYVVTIAGNFFGNAATPLTPGDSVICQTAAAAGSAAEADFIVVQSDTDLATLSAVGIGNVAPGTGIGVVYSNGTATVTNSDLGSSQFIFKNVTSDSGTAVADQNNDTLSIVGGTNVTTAVVGDVLTITATNTQTPARLAGVGLSLSGNTFNTNVDGVQSVAATASSSTAARTYKVQVDSSDDLVVNVPWVDTTVPDTGVTSVVDTEGTASTGTPLVASITGRVLTIDSRKYAGAANIGYVPQGGSSSTFLRGDGTWVTPVGGVTSVSASTAVGLRGLSATPTTGAVVTGLDIANMVAGTVGSTTEFPGVNSTTNFRFGADDINAYLRTKNSYAATITGFGSVTHSLNSFDVIVQLYNATTYETVEACIDRTSVNAVAIAGSAFPAGNIRVLVSRVG